MMRWWWFGPSVTRTELDRELDRDGRGRASAGSRWPSSIRSVRRTTTFMSDEFLADLRFAADRAHELGLRFDLTLGSGWSFGGPHISDDTGRPPAALGAPRDRAGRRSTCPAVAPWPGDELVAAYVGAGSLQEPPAAYAWLPVADGRLQIEPGSRAPASCCSRTPAAPARTSSAPRPGPRVRCSTTTRPRPRRPTCAAVGDPMLDAVPAELVGSVFCDSLEVYGADWTPGLPAEFARRRGYDLLPVLHLLTVDGRRRGPAARRLPPHAGRAVRGELRRRLPALGRRAGRAVPDPELRDAAGHGQQLPVRRPLRGRGLGLAGDPPDPVGVVGRPTSTGGRWSPPRSGPGCTRPPSGPPRWTSRARPTSTCSTGSTSWSGTAGPTRRPTPRARLVLLRRRRDGRPQPVVAGHAGAQRYLSRLCWLLQQGEPVADVAVYVPDDDLFAAMGRAPGGSLDTWREARGRIPSRRSRRRSGPPGWTSTWSTTTRSRSPPPDATAVVVVPATTSVPPATAAGSTGCARPAARCRDSR